MDEACIIPYDSYKTYVGDVTLHAGWDAKKYTVKWVDFDSTELKSEKVTYKGTGTAPVDPAMSGYTFTGWSSSDKSVATVSAKGKVSVKKAWVTYITAEAGGAVVKCKVTVKQTGIKEVLI